MSMTARDQRALIILAVAVVVMAIIYFWPAGDAGADVVAASTDSVPGAEKRLERVRQLSAEVPGRQAQLEKLQAELEQRETGLIRTETGQQAQAELLQVLRRLGSSQSPPVDFRSTEIGQIRPLGESQEYGEALVSVTFDCAIEQLVNLVADLTTQKQAIVTEEIRIAPQGKPDQKRLRVRMSIAGLVPASLVPKRKGLSTF